MKYTSKSVDDYISQIPEDRQTPFSKLRATIQQNIPRGFEEGIGYDMPAFYVPHSKYPDGYHTDPKLPLPFVNFASQKNFIALYHSGLYANKEIHDWFVGEYPNHCKRKLDMGKSCVRFKSMDDIPYELIAELMKKMSVDDWIALYEKNVQSK